jgi:hypothetical protein
MAGRECYHCKQWIESGDDHDCWTTTEAALTQELSEDLRDAWERLRETAASFGDQRIYASLNSIMFARRICYTFVRPKRKYLELVIFLRRTQKSPLVHKTMPASRTKVAHLIRLTHRDQVEPPVTDWIREAYETIDLVVTVPRSPERRAGAAKKSSVSTADGAKRTRRRVKAATKSRPAKKR